MLFNSALYLIFLAIVVILYYIVPSQRVRNVFLLVSSYFFYMQWNSKYAYLLFFVTLITYLGAIFITSNIVKEDVKKKKICLIICLSVNLLILFAFKYLDLFINYTNTAFSFIGMPKLFNRLNLVLPVGISFFILQSLGYLIDVYRGDIEVEKDFITYGLFVSFFPQLVAGPIERSKNLLHQFKNKIKFKYENLQRGLYYIMYGLLIKMVIADNLSTLVDNIYAKPNVYTGWYLIIATLAFAIQIYCDFYGYSTIARGSAKLLGIELMNNFDAPYFARSIKEFWHRWHISLSTWFRDYVYIPLGGNKNGRVKTYLNLLIVFLISGLWHGASLSFILWGLINGLFQILEDIFERIFHKNNLSYKKGIINLLLTNLLILFSWIFFRSGSWHNSKIVLSYLFSNLDNLSTFSFENLMKIWDVPLKLVNGTCFTILLLIFLDYIKYKKIDILNYITKKNIIIRYYIIILLFVLLIIFGHYGDYYDPQKFIYFQF